MFRCSVNPILNWHLNWPWIEAYHYLYSTSPLLLLLSTNWTIHRHVLLQPVYPLSLSDGGARSTAQRGSGPAACLPLGAVCEWVLRGSLHQLGLLPPIPPRLGLGKSDWDQGIQWQPQWVLIYTCILLCCVAFIVSLLVIVMNTILW